MAMPFVSSRWFGVVWIDLRVFFEQLFIDCIRIGQVGVVHVVHATNGAAAKSFTSTARAMHGALVFGGKFDAVGGWF